MNNKRLISIEGIDTAGKSTQCEVLRERLEKENKKVIVIHFPRYESTIGKFIKTILNDKKLFNDLNKDVLQKLYTLDQLDAQDTLTSLLDEGYFVILDRYDVSTMVYHSVTTKTPLVASIEKTYSEDLIKPHKTFILTLPDEVVIKRKDCLDEMEKCINISLMHDSFKEVQNVLNDREFITIDAQKTIQEINDEIYNSL